MNKKGLEIQMLLILVFVAAALAVMIGILVLGKEDMLDKFGIILNIFKFGG